ncbi:MAG: hypothetical protein FWF43_06605, partial [Propionibacteriaceae bacterium]|nr:hypothetical protein [Propionibacteriaceae bacterium]
PDSDVTTLKIEVLNCPDATVNAGVVTIPQKSSPQIVTYRLTDPQGGQSAALIYVPAISDGLPYVTGPISIDQDSTQEFNLADYVASMRGLPVRITTDDTVQASPSTALAMSMTSVTGFQLTSSNGYVGPASVSMEVTDGTSLADPNGRTTVVSIPVQVGPDTPVMYCPDTAQVIQVGQTGSPTDITSLCHVWTPDPALLNTLTYCAAFVNAPKDVSVAATPDMRGMILSALGTATAGDTGTLSITIDGTAATPAMVNVQVVGAAKPRINPITADTQGGQPVSGTISLTSPLVNGRQDTIVSIAQAPGTTTDQASVSGGGTKKWTVTPAADFAGTLTYTITVSDVADTSVVARQTSTTLTVNVINVPEAPTAPVAGTSVQSHAIQLSWKAPNDHGVSIDRYILEDDKGTQWTCPSTSCTAQPVDNAPTTYKFHVLAVNKVGQGPWSPWSTSIQADTVPTTVTGFTASNPKDGAIDLAWNAMTSSACGCNVAGLSYTISWPGGSKQGVTGTTTTVSGLPNNQTTFSIWAVNAQGTSKTAATVTGWPSGAPGTFTVDKPSASNLNTDSAAVTLTWSTAFPNGQGPVQYWVTDNGTTIASCQGITATTCKEDSISLDSGMHTFQVVAKNQPQQYSTTATASWSAEGQPPVMGSITVSPTGADQTIRITGTAPVSHGDPASSYIQVMIGGTVVQTIKAYNQAFDQSVKIPSANGTSVSVTARDCYDSTSNGPTCGAASPAVSVTPFGPLGPITLTVAPNNNVLNVTATANANGASATLAVTNTSGSEKDCDKSATNTSTVTITCSVTLGWSVSRTFSATFSSPDTNPVRSTQKATKSGTTAQPPAMTLGNITVTGNGPNLTAVVTGNGNGLGATLTIDGPCPSNSDSGTGALQASVTCTVGYSSSGSFTAKISNTDTAANRPDQTKSGSGTTSAPPDMTLGDIQVATQGSTLVATVTGNGNGVSATLTLQGPCNTDTHTGTGSLTASVTCDLGYNKTGTFTATFSNADKTVSRTDPTPKTASGQTAAGPEMTVTLGSPQIVQGYVTISATGNGMGYGASLTLTITGTTCSDTQSGTSAMTATLTKCAVGTGTNVGSNTGLTVTVTATITNTDSSVSRSARSATSQVTTWGPAAFKLTAGALESSGWNYLHYSLRNFTPNSKVTCIAYGLGGGDYTIDFGGDDSAGSASNAIDTFTVGATGNLDIDSKNATYDSTLKPSNTWALAGDTDPQKWATCGPADLFNGADFGDWNGGYDVGF